MSFKMLKDYNIFSGYDKQLKSVKFAFTKAHSSALGLIIYETYDYQAKIYQEIQQLLPEYKFLPVDVGAENITSLHRYLKEHLPTEILESEQISYVVSVFNLANSLLTFEEGKIKPSWLTAQINLERELLFRDIPCVLLIWLDKPSAEQFRKEAPDFWDWLTYIFEFKTPENEKVIEPIAYNQALPQRGADPEVLERIKDLEDKLARLDHNQPKMRVWREEKSIRYLLAQELVKVENYQKAEKHYLICLRILEKLNDFNEEKAEVYYQLGKLKHWQKKYESALENLEQSLKYAQHNLYGKIYHQMGVIYTSKRFGLIAIEYFGKAIEWKQKTQDYIGLGNSYHNLGLVYQYTHEWNLALENYQKAVEWKQKSGLDGELYYTFRNIGIVYKYMGKIDDAFIWFLKSLENNIIYKNLMLLEIIMNDIFSLLPKIKKQFKQQTLQLIRDNYEFLKPYLPEDWENSVQKEST
jgi:tetratricopeptide (TPR) repeat protein